jgi:hypothetical protein
MKSYCITMKREALDLQIREQFSSLIFLENLRRKAVIELNSQKRLIEILEVEKQQSRMSVICGNWGIGKSTAVAQFICSHQNVYYLRVDSPLEMLRELVYEISGFYPVLCRKKSSPLLERVVELLNLISEKKMLIIDDASRLGRKGVTLFFDLYKSSNNTALIFVGDIFSQTKRNRPSEFIDNVSEWYKDFPTLSEAEMKLYCKDNLIDFLKHRDRIMKCNTISDLESEKNVITAYG